jgi:DNA-binding beta-propeller fold protein YncE
MSTIARLYHTTSARLPLLEKKEGNLIFVTDTKSFYLDINDLRLKYDTIRVFDTDSQRVAANDLDDGFYFVQESNVLWSLHFGSWNQLTSSSTERIWFGTDVSDFPHSGDSKMLYVADNAIYRYDANTGTYEMVSNKTAWNNI